METKILKLESHDEEKEIAFELEYLASLTVEDRVQLVLDRSRLLLEMLVRGPDSKRSSTVEGHRSRPEEKR